MRIVWLTVSVCCIRCADVNFHEQRSSTKNTRKALTKGFQTALHTTDVQWNIARRKKWNKNSKTQSAQTINVQTFVWGFSLPSPMFHSQIETFLLSLICWLINGTHEKLQTTPLKSPNVRRASLMDFKWQSVGDINRLEGGSFLMFFLVSHLLQLKRRFILFNNTTMAIMLFRFKNTFRQLRDSWSHQQQQTRNKGKEEEARKINPLLVVLMTANQINTTMSLSINLLCVAGAFYEERTFMAIGF